MCDAIAVLLVTDGLTSPVFRDVPRDEGAHVVHAVALERHPLGDDRRVGTHEARRDTHRDEVEVELRAQRTHNGTLSRRPVLRPDARAGLRLRREFAQFAHRQGVRRDARGVGDEIAEVLVLRVDEQRRRLERHQVVVGQIGDQQPRGEGRKGSDVFVVDEPRRQLPLELDGVPRARLRGIVTPRLRRWW